MDSTRKATTVNDTDHIDILAEQRKREAEKRQRYDRDNASSREKRAQNNLKKSMAVETASKAIDLARSLKVDLRGVICPASEELAVLVRACNGVVQLLEVDIEAPQDSQAKWVDLPVNEKSRWDKSAWDLVASTRGLPPGGVIVSLTALTHQRSLGMFGQRSLR